MRERERERERERVRGGGEGRRERVTGSEGVRARVRVNAHQQRHGQGSRVEEDHGRGCSFRVLPIVHDSTIHRPIGFAPHRYGITAVEAVPRWLESNRESRE